MLRLRENDFRQSGRTGWSIPVSNIRSPRTRLAMIGGDPNGYAS
jgi:hypothetical protein